jgi:hypothetical protein
MIKHRPRSTPTAHLTCRFLLQRLTTLCVNCQPYMNKNLPASRSQKNGGALLTFSASRELTVRAGVFSIKDKKA